MKLFAAVRPTQKIIRTLTRLQRGVSGARWSDADKLHITLGYFGEVTEDEAEMLDTEMARIKMTGFDVTLSGAGHFGRVEPHAIWAGVDPSEELSSLHRHCARAARYCRVDMDRRNFKPHITLAYLRPNPNILRVIAFEKRLAAFKAGPFLVDEVILYSSHSLRGGGNVYQKEASYPLIG